jgi:hypothetical protein
VRNTRAQLRRIRFPPNGLEIEPGRAALALGKIGKAAEDAVPALVNILTDKQQSLEFRVEAAEALTNMGAIPAIRERIPQMLTVLGNPNEPGDLRIRTAWLFNEFLVAKQADAVKSGYDTFAKVCAEPSNKDNGSTRYHCAWLLGIVYQREAPDPALVVLEEWLYDTTGKLYGGKVASSGVSGTEKKSQDNVDAVLEGDSRVMAVQALKFIGKGRVRDRPKIVQQLQVLAKDEKTNPELKKDARDLLNLLGQ